MEFVLHISDGEITNKAKVRQAFTELATGKYLVRIDSIKKRSLSQNAYLHGVVIPLVFQGLRDAGFSDVKDKEDAKTVIKTLFLKRKIVNEKTDDVIEVVRRTRDLTTKEMMDFIDEVARWSSEYLGVIIPAPNEQLIMFAEF